MGPSLAEDATSLAGSDQSSARGARMEKLLLREDEARAVLGIGRTKLWELLSSGEIQSVSIGRSRRIPACALRQWVEERVAAATGPQHEAESRSKAA